MYICIRHIGVNDTRRVRICRTFHKNFFGKSKTHSKVLSTSSWKNRSKWVKFIQEKNCDTDPLKGCRVFGEKKRQPQLLVRNSATSYQALQHGASHAAVWAQEQIATDAVFFRKHALSRKLFKSQHTTPACKGWRRCKGTRKCLVKKLYHSIHSLLIYRAEIQTYFGTVCGGGGIGTIPLHPLPAYLLCRDLDLLWDSVWGWGYRRFICALTLIQ